MDVFKLLFLFLRPNRVIKVEESHPELEKALQKIIAGKSKVKMIHNGTCLDKWNRVIAYAYRRGEDNVI